MTVSNDLQEYLRLQLREHTPTAEIHHLQHNAANIKDKRKEGRVTFQMFGPLLPFYELNGGFVAKSCPTVATPWTIAHQAPLSMGFSRHKYWSDLTFPSPWNLLNPGIEPESPALQADSLLTELPEKPGYELKADIIYFRMKVKEESEKAGLKLNIQKTKSLAFSTIPS